MIHPDDDVYEGPGSNYEYCRFHPGKLVSNGVFDAPCGACEAAGDDWAEAWERNPENPERRYCGTDAPPVARWWTTLSRSERTRRGPQGLRRGVPRANSLC